MSPTKTKETYIMKYEETARRLIEALNDANLRPIDLANKSGINRASVSQYMSGTHQPTNITANKMAKVLKVNPMWLMGFDVDKYAELYTPQEVFDNRDMRVLFDAAKDLSSEDIQFVIQFIERMK